MKYTFSCPSCGEMMTTEAMNDDEAVKNFMDMGGKHMTEKHPDMSMDEQGMKDMENMVRTQMKKSE